jgi:PAS domain S-box-containing protein
MAARVAELEAALAQALQRAETAEAGAARLREVQEAVRRLSRSQGEGDVAAELGAQVARMVWAEIVSVVHVQLDDGRLRTQWRWVRGHVVPRPDVPLGAGLVADAARSGRTRGGAKPTPESLGLDDLDHDALAHTSALAVPMMAAQRLEGVLVAAWRDREPPPWAQDVLEALAAHAAAAMRNARLYAESERERRQSEALAAAAAAVSESLRLGEVQRLILRHAMALLRSEGAWLGLLEDRYVKVVSGVGSSAVLTGRLIPQDGTAEGRVIRDRLPVQVDESVEPADLFRPTQRAAGIRRTVMVPLYTARNVIGVLAANDRAVPFTEEDARTLQRLADQCAVAVFNARLFEEARAATLEWKLLFDAVPSGVVVLDDQGRVIRFNARAVTLAGGGAAHTLLGRTFGSVVHPGSSDDLLPPPVAHALAHGAGARGVVATPAGRMFDLLASPHPDGGVVVTFDDVTDLHALEQRHRSVVQTAMDAIVVTAPDRRLTFANPAACALFGTDALVGMLVDDLVEPERQQAVQRAEADAFDGVTQRYETVIRRADGALRTVAVVSAPLVEPGGRVAEVVASLRDVTDERHARDAIAKSEARYSRLVEAAGDAIFTLDEAGTITSVNRVLERTIGMRRQQLVGQPFTVLLERSPDRDALWRALHDTLRGTVQRAELQYRDGRGDLRTGSLMATPIEDDGRVVGVLSIVRDVTDERRLQQQLQLQERLAAIGELVSGVAHELNNPLAGVIAHSQLLLAVPDLDADAHEAAGVIHGEARRAARIVSHLLTFARQHRPQRAICDVSDMVRDTLALRRYAHRVLGIECLVDVPDTLPSTWADQGQLQQVVMNLLVNAEQALELVDHPRCLRVSAREEGEGLTVTVEDNGPGIPADVMPRIFNPFFTTKPVGKGTGLGLSLADGIVREHGGRIVVERLEGGGTRFRMELPRLDPPSEQVPPPTPAPRRALQVLVADPNPESRRLTARALADAGDTVLSVAEPHDVLEAARRRAWDIVLLDAALAGGADALYARLLAEVPDAAVHTVFAGPAHAPRPTGAAAGRPWLFTPLDLAALPARLSDFLR